MYKYAQYNHMLNRTCERPDVETHCIDKTVIVLKTLALVYRTCPGAPYMISDSYRRETPGE